MKIERFIFERLLADLSSSTVPSAEIMHWGWVGHPITHPNTSPRQAIFHISGGYWLFCWSTGSWASTYKWAEPPGDGKAFKFSSQIGNLQWKAHVWGLHPYPGNIRSFTAPVYIRGEAGEKAKTASVTNTLRLTTSCWSPYVRMEVTRKPDLDWNQRGAP